MTMVQIFNEHNSAAKDRIKFCVIEGRRVSKLPTRSHLTDAGIDFSTPDDFNEVTLNPNEQVLIQTGLKCFVPSGCLLWIYNKSGVSVKKQLAVGAGIIDEGYEGEIGINIYNRGNQPVTIKPNEKIAQGIIVPIRYDPVDIITEEEYNRMCNSDRGTGGFGSTGV